MMRFLSSPYGLLLALAACPSVALAQYQPVRPDLSQRSMPIPGLDRIGVDEKLGRTIPLDLTLRDLAGRSVRLRDYFTSGKPVLLTFAYHTCNTTCSFMLDAVERGIHTVPWTAGEEYQVLTVSLDPTEDLERARIKRNRLLEAYGRPAAQRGWHFLTADQATIERLTAAVGYRYFYDERQEQYAHPSVITFLSPEGKVARYLYGLDFAAFDVRLALFESSQGRSMNSAEHILQYCYAYDPATATYTAQAMRIMQLGGLVTLAFLGTMLTYFWRRERLRSSTPVEFQSTQALEVGA